MAGGMDPHHLEGSASARHHAPRLRRDGVASPSELRWMPPHRHLDCCRLPSLLGSLMPPSASRVSPDLSLLAGQSDAYRPPWPQHPLTEGTGRGVIQHHVAMVGHVLVIIDAAVIEHHRWKAGFALHRRNGNATASPFGSVGTALGGA